MELTDQVLNEFKVFCKLREDIKVDETPLKIDLLKQSFHTTSIYISNLKSYISDQTFCILLNNLWLHFFITDPLNNDLYKKYDIENKDSIISSVSAGGSSTSIQTFKSLEDGEYLMWDLNRTPYGRRAYSILESIKNIAII
ncbi:TPA: hypothetical protein R1765_001978 [Campylobacter coli]|nr:hypothetical protein [Campylobacter coli]